MDFQTILAVILLILTSGYLLLRYVVRPFQKSPDDKNCGPDCNCS